ncbi:MAG: hypothetical protein K6F30_04495 [Lachnospiraceae bacterium]|nr:hypothetical protein [Lachnospiraceae bacterium]
MEYNMPPVAGIDWEKAHHYLPSKELLLEVLTEFVSSADKQANTLTEFKDMVEQNPTPDNYASFRIHAHAMKSALRSIGADLFAEAYELEIAGKEEQKDVILEKTEDFTIEYLSLAESLKVIVGACNKKAAFNEDDFFAEIDEIKDAMTAFDISGLQDAMKRVSEMSIPSEFVDEVGELEEAVRNLVSNRVLECCENIEEMRIQ